MRPESDPSATRTGHAQPAFARRDAARGGGFARR